MLQLNADINQDGKVDSADLSIMLRAMNRKSAIPLIPQKPVLTRGKQWPFDGRGGLFLSISAGYMVTAENPKGWMWDDFEKYGFLHPKILQQISDYKNTYGEGCVFLWEMTGQVPGLGPNMAYSSLSTLTRNCNANIRGTLKTLVELCHAMGLRVGPYSGSVANELSTRDPKDVAYECQGLMAEYWFDFLGADTLSWTMFVDPVCAQTFLDAFALPIATEGLIPVRGANKDLDGVEPKSAYTAELRQYFTQRCAQIDMISDGPKWEDQTWDDFLTARDAKVPDAVIYSVMHGSNWSEDESYKFLHECQKYNVKPLIWL